MLKLVFMDLVPYVINEAKIFNTTWKNILGQQYDDFSNNDILNKILNKNLLLTSTQNQLIPILSDEDFKIILQKYINVYPQVEKEYFENLKLPDYVTRFLNNAKVNDCKVVFATWHQDYVQSLRSSNLLTHVEYLELSEAVGATSHILFDYASNSNISVHEFLCITQEQNTINDMLEKGYFCATISDIETDVKNLYTISSIEELDFENIRFNFYENVENESEDL